MTNAAIRKNLRFNADENAVVWISKDAENFKEDIIGLLDSESFSGFSMVVLRERNIQEGDELLLKVGNFAPTKAVVRWIKVLEKEVYKFGFEYIDS